MSRSRGRAGWVGLLGAGLLMVPPTQDPQPPRRPSPRPVFTGEPFLRDVPALGAPHWIYLSALARGSAPSATPAPEASVTAMLGARYAQRYGISPRFAERIVAAALAEGIDPELGFRIIWVESRFVSRARGRSGSLGLMQLMPGTARRLDPSVEREDLFDPDTNLRLGFRYLRRLIRMFGDVRLGVLAYNRGEDAVARALRRGQDPENGYSRKVLGPHHGLGPYRGTGLVERAFPGPTRP